jgi:hypothetical protein
LDASIVTADEEAAMSLFGKSRHEKDVESLVRLTTHLFDLTAGDSQLDEARAVRFERADFAL